jgi:octaprenyl-diphosphate synthase
LGTDLAKGKLTLPLLLLWQRADADEKARLQDCIQEWKPQCFAPVMELLRRHETLGESVEIIGQYLEKARQALEVVPDSPGHAGLAGLAKYLAQQTESLGTCA